MSQENPSSQLDVEFIYLPVINYSMQQNRIPVIRLLSIKNNTERPLTDLKVSLTLEPEFASVSPVMVEKLASGEIIKITGLHLTLDPSFFIQQTERLSGSIVLVVSNGADEFFREKYPIDILAFDQWGGIQVLPELLSAFVVPNHPILTGIILRASSILKEWSGNSSLDAYQSCNPNRIKLQLAALYESIKEQHIAYCTPPPSFGDAGQRVRLSDNVLSGKLATCLDMSLLYASCVEAMGLHPLLVIIKGHAFVGCWLIDVTFPDAVNDDPSLLTKRTADGINEVILLEATCMNDGNNVTFDTAVGLANDKMLAVNDFTCFIDVARSRFVHILPLPQRVMHGKAWTASPDVAQVPEGGLHISSACAPEEIKQYDLDNQDCNVEFTKQLLWERKLLDLSLRNNFLNLRITRNALQVISVDIDKMEDAFSDGMEFQILGKPADWDNPLYDFGLYGGLTESDPMTGLIKQELTQKRLRTYLTEQDLKKSLTYLYRSSRIALEENGANTLYLALGLLRWYETEHSERPRYAPILLLPVEMIRKSVSKGYIIRAREEETMLNITLLEMLRQNFGITISGLDSLPKDENGADVKRIFSIFRKAVMNEKRWDIEEQAILGTFSFSKFIMWNDIHSNAEELSKNKIVGSLISGKMEWEVAEVDANAIELDRTLTPADIALPVSADSSQLEAVYEAVNEKSFILHGPPGTGKSQTITNIIANALYQGKRVLFVAEKMAALSVVQKRLTNIGLAPFCLELHSNKARKTDVLGQLKESTEIFRYKEPEEFKEEAERLFKMRQQINRYVEALHWIYPCGISVYEAITRYSSIDETEEIMIPASLLASLTKEQLNEWNHAVEELIGVGKVSGHSHNHPLTGINIMEYSSQLKEEADKLLKDYMILLQEMQGKMNKCFFNYGIENKCTEKLLDNFILFIQTLMQLPGMTGNLILLTDLDENVDKIRRIIEHGRKRDELCGLLKQTFEDTFLTFPAQQKLEEWKEITQSWFLPRLLKQRSFCKELSLFSSQGRVGKKHVLPALQQLLFYQQQKQEVDNNSRWFQDLFGNKAHPGEERWDDIEVMSEAILQLNRLLMGVVDDTVSVRRVKEKLAEQLSEGYSLFRQMNRELLEGLVHDWGCIKQLEKSMLQLLGVSTEVLHTGEDDWLAGALRQCGIWVKNTEKLKDWYRWLNVSRRFEACGLNSVFAAYTERNLPTERMMNIYLKGFYRSFTEYAIGKEQVLQFFNGELFNDSIRRFRELNTRYQELIKKELYTKLASNIPSFVLAAAQSSEVGILQKCIRSNGRGMSIRKLFDSISNLLSRMCPCMLMSPMSVAQYIDVNHDKFDLVVFDEASQMPTCEAVGAIARGNHVVVVGDPKQMPPTNFFTSNSVDEEHIEIEDLESILDDCLALSMPSKYLLWHYRSKHESLIAFSNSQYYDNKLLTFPSPDDLAAKVTLVPIEGYYDKGKSRQNQAEAQAVVDEIVRRLSDPELRNQSIGVVTFSSVQQTLIEDMLSDAVLQDADLENLAFNREEPVFIKNLENVQGDERDVILFSVGYGPDVNGRVSLNFGPLNRDGGERRLNVAVSRARYEMKVFSTLRADQIDLKKTSSIGVAGLKYFLEYAGKGTGVLNHSYATASEDSEISTLIATALREKGHQVKTRIGCSGFRVDVGIIDPDDPSRYLLGVLCDGENYRTAKTARDREIVQGSVLKMLGWNICKVWTMDWWEDSQKVIDYIEEKLKSAQCGRLGLPAQVTALAPVSGEVQKAGLLCSAQRCLVKSVKPEIYEKTPLSSVNLSAWELMMPRRESRIIKQLEEVMCTEAPISRSLLINRIFDAYGVLRKTARLIVWMDSILDKTPYYKQDIDGLIFYWNTKEDAESYTGFRVDSKREAVDLPPREVANAVRSILEQQVALPLADLMRVTARLLGFSRFGLNVETAMRRGVQILLDGEEVKIEGDKILMK
ncbi:DUF4011 domain-containing protein [Bacteroides fragilis]|uniref:DUF4011 domain-containing protein n=1 Tax=Bacteroides fragilis TaxID=817 RepID=UPI001C6FFB63|nr:DUF3320 domain-containing protein [Bacteroides fragilis]MBW9278584.1 DUF3320 domain-containing protein [Bacteroides fragilis]